MRRDTALLVLSFALAFVLGACGGGNAASTSGSGGSAGAAGSGVGGSAGVGGAAGAAGAGGATAAPPDLSSLPITMTPLERLAALNKVRDFRNTLPGTDRYADNVALVGYLKTLPAFYDEGIRGQNVWARYKDGLPVLFVNNRSAPPPVPQPLSGLPPGMPAGDKALVLNVAGLAGGSDVTINKWLNNAGYASSTATASLSLLRGSIKNVDVLYYATHGGLPTDKAGNKVYVLGTTDHFTKAQFQAHDTGNPIDWKEYEQGLLVQMQFPKSPKNIGNWTVTRKFVKKYWSFNQNSLVDIDACRSMYGDPAVATFTQTLGDVGADAVLGWTDDVEEHEAPESALFLFSRLLGESGVKPLRSPPPRPWDLASSLYDMGHTSNPTPWHTDMPHNYDESRSIGKDDSGKHIEIDAYFIQEQFGSTTPLLRPSIKNLEVDEYQQQLTLHGEFGSQKGIVTVGGQTLSIVSWAQDKIVASLPATISAGEVQVSTGASSEHHSNKVPLTEWHPQFDYLVHPYGSTQLTQEVTCSLRIRADIHAYRDSPDMSVVQPSNVIFARAPDSTCDFKMSGTDTVSGAPITLSGQGSLQMAGKNGASGNDFFNFSGTVDSANPQLSYFLSIGAQGSESIAGQTTVPMSLISDPQLLLGTGIPPSGVPLGLDSTFGIPAKTTTGNVAGSNPVTLTITATPATLPPDPNKTPG